MFPSCTCNCLSQDVASAVRSSGSDTKSSIDSLKSDVKTAIENSLVKDEKSVSNSITKANEELRKLLSGSEATNCNSNTKLPANVRFCSWNAPEWGGEYEIALGLAIALFSAWWEGQLLDDYHEIEDAQYELADRYATLAENKYYRWRDGGYKALELSILNETDTTPVRVADCVGARNRASISVTTAYNNANEDMAFRAQASQMCLDDALIQALQVDQARMLTDTINFAYRDEEWFTDYANDKRWNRRSDILNLGRNLSTLSATYGELAGEALKGAGTNNQRLQGMILGGLGYIGSRNDTSYPRTMMGASVFQATNPKYNSAATLSTDVGQASSPPGVAA